MAQNKSFYLSPGNKQVRRVRPNNALQDVIISDDSHGRHDGVHGGVIVRHIVDA